MKIKHLFFFTIFCFCTLKNFSQNIIKTEKIIKVNLGLKFRVVPIYLNNYTDFQINYYDYLLQIDPHLSGFSIYFNSNYKLTNKSFIEFNISPRYDIAESKFTNGVQGPVKKNIFIDYTFGFSTFFKNSNTKNKFAFLISLNNFNSEFNFYNSYNMYYSQSNFKFTSYQLKYEKLLPELNVGFLVEYVSKHNFSTKSKLLMPSIFLTHKIFN